MSYIYSPDLYNYSLIKSKFKNEQEFIKYQVKYRAGIEKILSSFINFNDLEKYILGQEIEIPKVLDEEYNFYHKYSSLGSNYIFLRNNFHVENLSSKELDYLISKDNLDRNFYIQTLEKVMFENENETFFGPAIDENAVKSNSLVFEFSYDQAKCSNLEQLNKINEISNRVFEILENSIKENLKLDSSFIIYKAIPDLFYKANNPIYRNLK